MDGVNVVVGVVVVVVVVGVGDDGAVGIAVVGDGDDGAVGVVVVGDEGVDVDNRGVFRRIGCTDLSVQRKLYSSFA